MALKYAKSTDVAFVVIEQKEPHTGRMAFESIEQPTTFAERCTLARRIRDELELPLPIYVDGMDDASRALFSDLPGPAFVLDRFGRIVDKQEWVDPDALAQRLTDLLAINDMPTGEAAPWTLDEREAIARRFLAAGKPVEALAWLDTKPVAAISETPTPVTVAQAALMRARLLLKAPAAERIAALEAAAKAVAAAWPGDATRRTAARIELAEVATDTAAESRLWQQAFDSLDSKAPVEVRVWLRQKRDVAAKR